MSESLPISFGELQKKEQQFIQNVCPFPVESITLAGVVGKDKSKQEKIVKHAGTVHPVIHPKVYKFLQDFLTYKQLYGSAREKKIYQDMELPHFIKRLYTNRPLVYYTAQEEYLLPEKDHQGKNIMGAGNYFDLESVKQGKYLFKDEVNIAMFLGVSSDVMFINKGDRDNRGVVSDDAETFREEGVYTGLVGTCFEKSWGIANLIFQEILEIDAGVKKLWLDFLEVEVSETVQAVKDSRKNENFEQLYESIYISSKKKHVFFDKKVYKKLMYFVIQPFLVNANNQAKQRNTKAYVHCVGLGLGNWAMLQGTQAMLQIEVYEEILKEEKLDNIAVIDFSHFPKQDYPLKKISKDDKIRNIKISFSTRNPADPLPKKFQKLLLVAMYAWDNNAFPGNEVFLQKLTASGDPAAACCSTIILMQTPTINPCFDRNIIKTINENMLEESLYARISNFIRINKTNLSLLAALLAAALVYHCHY